jgi:hypothetical protein
VTEHKKYLSAEAHGTATGSWALVFLEESLLSLARRLIEEDQHSTAIVVAHVACEAAVTRALNKSLVDRDQADLAEPMLGAMNGHALVNKQNRDLYTALTGDASITSQAFWKDYHRSIEWRNHVVHSGKVYGRAEAEGCVSAATEFVSHVHEAVGIRNGA